MRNSVTLLILAFCVSVSGCISTLETSQNYDTSITEDILESQDIKEMNSEFDQSLYYVDNNSNVHADLNEEEVIAARQNSFVANLLSQEYSRDITSFYASSIFVYNNTETASRDFNNFKENLSYDIATLERKEQTQKGFIVEVTVSSGNKITSVYRRRGNAIFYTSIGHFEEFKTQEAIDLANKLEQKINS